MSELQTATGQPKVESADWRKQFRLRLNVLFGLLVLWTIVIGARMTMLMTEGISGADDPAQSGEFSWQTYVLPAMRGRILDSTGIPLAWSEREWDLVYFRPSDTDLIWRDMLVLQDRVGLEAEELVGRVKRAQDGRVVLKEGISAQAVAALHEAADEIRRREGPAAIVRFIPWNRFVRHHCRAARAILLSIGETRQFGMRQVGISGLERKHNAELMGVDGKCRVMVDRDGNWVQGTWTELQPPRTGFDQYVGISLNPAGIQ